MCFMRTSSPSFRETKTGGFPSLKLPYLNNMHTKVSKVEFFKLPPVQKKRSLGLWILLGGVLCMNEVELPS